MDLEKNHSSPKQTATTHTANRYVQASTRQLIIYTNDIKKRQSNRIVG